MKLENIKTVQQEKELNKFIYNGALTAVLFLADIRKGDIIEYSYTIKGFNPIFKNKYAAMYVTQYGVPVYRIFYKLIVPKARSITVKNSLATIEPAIKKTEAATSYEWTLTNVAALHTDDNLPSWYDCYPAVMVSEFSSWKEVSDWAVNLFPFNKTLPASLQKKAEEIKAKYSTVQEQAVAAVRFVQDDIRYMGIEMGIYSHQPHSPAQIFNQRFGDCKDKAYLLCTLLRALHIEAWPVLNNTSYKKTIATWLPSPHSFDHATVCATIGNKTYWFDATISYQRGSIKDISYPDYQAGLVVKPGTTELTAIPLQETGKVTSKEIFYVKKSTGPVALEVITTSSGSFADNIRYAFKNSSLKEIQKTYKRSYTFYFKKIEADSLTYEDDDKTGSFTSREYYTIRDFWTDEGGKSKILLEPYFIDGVIKKPKEEKRTMPFALAYPARYEEEIEIRLPDDWPVEESKHQFNTASFDFHYNYSRPSTSVVRLRYSYENKADHIMPAATEEYLNQLAEADKTSAFELYNTTDAGSFTSLPASSNKGFTTAYTILAILAIATYFYRRTRGAGY